MAKKHRPEDVTEAAAATTTDDDEVKTMYCCQPPVPAGPPLHGDLHPDRSFAINLNVKKWVSGTVLRYWFFDAEKKQKDAVRRAFQEWMALRISIRFVEVPKARDAEVRISFDPASGSWSYVGRDVLTYGKDHSKATMNFGWDLTTPYGHTTALHEIGHTLGLEHEHQNPKAGITWDNNAVYAYMAGPPNYWDHAKTDHNILNKLTGVNGTNWDVKSVMHYAFPPHLIKKPPQYYTSGVPENTWGLSPLDKEWIKKVYPAAAAALEAAVELRPFESHRLDLGEGEEAVFTINPSTSREYTITTLGVSDSLLVLNEVQPDGSRVLVKGVDDAGTEENAKIVQRLQEGRHYELRVRLFYARIKGNFAVMVV